MTETSKCPVWIAPINSSREEPMKELIEKQAAIDAVMQYCPDDDGSCSKADRDIRELLDDIENLPSAQPERKKGKREHIGHWIFVHPLQENDPGAYICSECKTGDWDIDPAKDKVCKFCEAKMI